MIAGGARAGEDLPEPSVPRQPLKPSAALAVDGLTKDYKLDSSGRRIGAHWVDAAAFDLLRIPIKSIRSAPAIGNRTSEIRYIDKQKIRAQVEDCVALAWKLLLDKQLVTILDIVIDTHVRGRLVYRVDYVNNVTKKPEKVTL